MCKRTLNIKQRTTDVVSTKRAGRCAAGNAQVDTIDSYVQILTSLRGNRLYRVLFLNR